MSSKEPILVLAGNHAEFVYHARRFRENFYPIYLSEVRVIRGRRDGKYICVGNWMRKPERELAEIREILRMSGFREVGYSEVINEDLARNALLPQKTWEQKTEESRLSFYSEEEFIKEEEMWL